MLPRHGSIHVAACVGVIELPLWGNQLPLWMPLDSLRGLRSLWHLMTLPPFVVQDSEGLLP